jgi:hypothetical protein
MCLRKGWWKSGDRRTTRAKGPYEIWCSKSIGLEGSFTLPGQLRWTPEPVDDNPRIQAYLNALPGSQYNNKGISVVATDDPTSSSTRVELAAILLALRQANPAETLILLVDSTAAIHRLGRFRS